MQIFLGIIGIVALFSFIGLLFLLFIYSRPFFPLQDHPWLEFARVHKLQFDQGGRHVFGDFHGRYLDIRQISGSRQDQTLITLQAPPNTFNPELIKDTNQVNTALSILISETFGKMSIIVDSTPQKFISKANEFLGFSELQVRIALLERLLEAYPIIVCLGGKSVEFLHPIACDPHHTLQQIARQFLVEIGEYTSKQWRDVSHQSICPYCLLRCMPHSIRIPQSLGATKITYYGCRRCQQSQEFVKCIAVLNRGMADEQRFEMGILQVNWLIKHDLFDFLAVEIIDATDEDVERFAVQVGNDIDPVRKPLYKKMRCTISSQCKLSLNTIRILDRTFGEVKHA